VLVKVQPILERVEDWGGFVAAVGEDGYGRLYERHERTGRPLGPKRFLLMLEKALARPSSPASPAAGRRRRRNRSGVPESRNVRRALNLPTGRAFRELLRQPTSTTRAFPVGRGRHCGALSGCRPYLAPWIGAARVVADLRLRMPLAGVHAEREAHAVPCGKSLKE